MKHANTIDPTTVIGYNSDGTRHRASNEVILEVKRALELSKTHAAMAKHCDSPHYDYYKGQETTLSLVLYYLRGYDETII